jgi:hypothetical protein
VSKCDDEPAGNSVDINSDIQGASVMGMKLILFICIAIPAVLGFVILVGGTAFAVIGGMIQAIGAL